MAFFDIFRKKDATEKFKLPISRRGNDKYLLTLAEAFKPLGRKITKVQRMEKRVDPKKLELAARLDELTFRCVNFYALQVVGPGFDLIGDAKSVKVCQEFIDRTHLLEKLEDIVRDMCITGNGWLEKIYNSKGEMVDVARIDPRFMDFKRTSLGFVEEDESGNITGYVFTDWAGQKIFLEPHQVAHFKLFGMGNERALGFVEPLYQIIYDKLNARKGFSQEQWRSGYPLYVAYVGAPATKEHPEKKPEAEFAQKLADELEDIKVRTKYVLPWWVKLEKLEPSKTGSATELLEFFNQGICAGFGIPYDIAMGVGKGNRATLEVATVRDLDRRIRSIQNKVSMVIEKDIFGQLKNQFKLKSIPKIRWREITPPDLNRKAKRLVEFVNAGILKPEDVRELVYQMEDLVLDKKVVEKEKAVEKLKK